MHYERWTMRNLMSTLISLCLGVFFSAVWLTTVFYDGESIGETNVLLAVIGLPIAAAFFMWLGYRSALMTDGANRQNPHPPRESAPRSHSLRDLYNDSPAGFLRTVTSLFERLGYRVGSAALLDDATAELRLDKDGHSELAWCRRTASNTQADDVIEFLKKIAISETARGFMITTGHYTLPAREAALGTELHLIDGPELSGLLSPNGPS